MNTTSNIVFHICMLCSQWVEKMEKNNKKKTLADVCSDYIKEMWN